MKKVISLLMATFLSTGVFSAGSEYFSAVLNSSALNDKEIKLIEHDFTNTYRCLGCYDFRVTIINSLKKEEVLNFQTELRLLEDTIVVIRK